MNKEEKENKIKHRLKEIGFIIKLIFIIIIIILTLGFGLLLCPTSEEENEDDYR